jgi:hypothetical protein
MSDDTGISPVTLGVVIALLAVIGHIIAGMFTF